MYLDLKDGACIMSWLIKGLLVCIIMCGIRRAISNLLCVTVKRS